MQSLLRKGRAARPIKTRQDFIQIAKGVPHTKKQWLKYEPWEKSKTPLLCFDENFLYLTSDGITVYNTIHLRRDEWLREAKDKFSFHKWLNISDDSETVVNLEICSGFGQWFRSRVAETKSTDNIRWISCEIKFRRCMSILGRLNYKLDKEHLQSVARVICSEALFAMDNLFPDAICDNIYIRFPEPWSTKGNAHKRIINHRMGMLLAWKLKRNGTLIVTTDDMSFRDHTIQVFYEMRELWCHESTVAEEPNSNNIPESVNETASDDEELNIGGFENMLKERGCKIYHMTFRRV